jgi:holo-[acyl-carrier protein] synthase
MTIPGVGLDLVAITRFATVLERRPRVGARLFTAVELADTAGNATRLAARFAAKEACLKALGVGLGAGSFHDVEVGRASGGAPTLTVRGTLAALAHEAGVTSWAVSLSHDGDVAGAIVLARF